MANINRPSSRRKLANLIVALMRQIDRLFAPSGTGTTFFVSSSTGVDDTAHGRSTATPFATVAYAVSQCTDDANDVIKCLAGHAETIDAAADIAMSKRGVTVMGLGQGSKRPTFTWATDTAATITMTAANCRFTNCIFDMSLPSALVSGIVISAASCKIDQCLFKIGTAGTGTRPLQAILTTAAADNLEISDNKFIEPTATPTTVSASSTQIKLVGGSGIRILRNYMRGWCTTSVGPITSITTLNSDIEIRDNIIINATASSTKGIVLLTGSTGMIRGNSIQILSGTAPITADAASWAGGNYYAASIATAGTLV